MSKEALKQVWALSQTLNPAINILRDLLNKLGYGVEHVLLEVVIALLLGTEFRRIG